MYSSHHWPAVSVDYSRSPQEGDGLPAPDLSHMWISQPIDCKQRPNFLHLTCRCFYLVILNGKSRTGKPETWMIVGIQCSTVSYNEHGLGTIQESTHRIESRLSNSRLFNPESFIWVPGRDTCRQEKPAGASTQWQPSIWSTQRGPCSYFLAIYLYPRHK